MPMTKEKVKKIAVRKLWKAERVEEVVSVETTELYEETIVGEALCHIDTMKGKPVVCEFVIHEDDDGDWYLDRLALKK